MATRFVGVRGDLVSVVAAEVEHEGQESEDPPDHPEPGHTDAEEDQDDSHLAHGFLLVRVRDRRTLLILS